MKQLNDKIITWLKHHNIDKLSPNKQYLKIIEEVGELARGLLKNDLEAIKDAIGDIYVALMGYKLQNNLYSFEYDVYINKYTDIENLSLINFYLSGDIHMISYDVEHILGKLYVIAKNNKLTLKDCVSHAYNEIKDRDIKIVEGVAKK